MKKLLIIPFVFLLFSFFSCEKDESLDPLPTIVGGQFVRLDITKKLLASQDIDNAEFGGHLTTPSNNVVKYELYVRYKSTLGVISNNYVLLKTITTFPYDLKVTPSELAQALNLPLSSLSKGDEFRFLGYSYDANNKVADYNSLSATVKTQPGMKQAYKFVTQLADNATVEQNSFDNYQL
jgi:hypothetical protein